MNDAAPQPGQKPSISAQVSDFVNNMDARAWRAVWVTFALFVVVGVMLVIGRLYFNDEIERFVKGWLGSAGREHWGLPAAIVIFTIAAFVGAPQFVLVAACVVAFGPETAFWYAWIATSVSGAATYAIGKLTGGRLLRNYGGATGGRFTRFMGQNGFLASFVVRFVPTAPFVVVNMAMATAGVGFWAFLAGLALGSLPKIAMVAFAGDGIMDALEGKLGTALLAALVAILLWFAVVWVVRLMVRKDEENGATSD